jgi:hypothetical protein
MTAVHVERSAIITCATCGAAFSPAYRPTHGPATCGLCLLRAEIAKDDVRTIEQVVANERRLMDAAWRVAFGPKGVYGDWCRDPTLCAGRGSCPRDPACNE